MRLSLESKYNIDKFSSYEMRCEDQTYYNKCSKNKSKESLSFEDARESKSNSFELNVVNRLKTNGDIYDADYTPDFISSKNLKCAYCSKIHRRIKRRNIYSKRNLNSGSGNATNSVSVKNKNNIFCLNENCPIAFKNMQWRKRVWCKKGGIPSVEKKKRCLHSNCTQTFSKLMLLLNHLKNEHFTTKTNSTLQFRRLQEFEVWKKEFASQFVLLKRYRTMRNVVFSYYGCPVESSFSNECSDKSGICQGKLFVAKRRNNTIVNYIPHDENCKRKEKHILSKNADVESSLNQNTNFQLERLLLILSNRPTFHKLNNEEDVESLKKSVKNCINQLNECVRLGDVQILMNMEYMLKEMIKTFIKNEEKKHDSEELGEPLQIRLTPLQLPLEKVSTTPTTAVVETFTQHLKDADDVNKVIFNVGPYAISSLHLKSLDYNIPAAECAILKSVAPDFRKGWLYDTIIDAFLYKLCKPCPNAMFLETAVSQIINSNSLNSLRMQLGEKYFNNIEHIFVTFNPNGKHWVLLVVKPKFKLIEIFDPTSRKKCAGQSLMKFVKQLICVLLNDFGSNETWGIVSPKHIIQKGNYNCGVYVCWYAERILNNQDVLTEFSGSEFRKYIYNFIRSCDF